jgi:hypothetical protein
MVTFTFLLLFYCVIYPQAIAKAEALGKEAASKARAEVEDAKAALAAMEERIAKVGMRKEWNHTGLLFLGVHVPLHPWALNMFCLVCILGRSAQVWAGCLCVTWYATLVYRR